MKIVKFEDILAWQKARELTRRIYKITNETISFKKDYGLSNQIQRAAVSIMSNIAEGFARKGKREFHNFLNIAKGSAAEVQSQLYISLDLGYINRNTFHEIYQLAEEISKLLTGFQKYLRMR